MKKIYLLICILSSFFMFFTPGESFAAEEITVEVTEKIPGVECEENTKKEGIYNCKVGKGFSSITVMFGKLIRFFTYIVALAGVLFIVINGILYTMSGIDAGLKDTAKKRIVQTLIGLIILLMSGTILYSIAPWIYTA